MARTTFSIEGIMPGWEEILERNVNIIGDSALSTHAAAVAGDDGPSAVSPSAGDYIDVCQGFSNRLLLLINDICNLPGGSRQDAAAAVKRIDTCLENLEQLPPSSLQSDPTGASPELEAARQRKLDVITATAEANMLSAFVFLDETCRIHWPGIVPECRASLQKHISRIFSLVEEICEKEPVTAALPIWPVFIAGCSLDKDEDRVRLLGILDKFKWQQLFGVSFYHPMRPYGTY